MPGRPVKKRRVRVIVIPVVTVIAPSSKNYRRAWICTACFWPSTRAITISRTNRRIARWWWWPVTYRRPALWWRTITYRRPALRRRTVNYRWPSLRWWPVGSWRPSLRWRPVVTGIVVLPSLPVIVGRLLPVGWLLPFRLLLSFRAALAVISLPFLRNYRLDSNSEHKQCACN